jgi:hypothetical protein
MLTKILPYALCCGWTLFFGMFFALYVGRVKNKPYYCILPTDYHTYSVEQKKEFWNKGDDWRKHKTARAIMTLPVVYVVGVLLMFVCSSVRFTTARAAEPTGTLTPTVTATAASRTPGNTPTVTATPTITATPTTANTPTPNVIYLQVTRIIAQPVEVTRQTVQTQVVFVEVTLTPTPTYTPTPTGTPTATPTPTVTQGVNP